MSSDKTFAIKFIGVSIPGKLTGATGKKETRPVLDENGEQVYEWKEVYDDDGKVRFDDEGNMVLEKGPVLMEEVDAHETVDVIYVVDTPPKVEAARIRRIQMVLALLQEQTRVATDVMVGKVMAYFSTLQRHAKEIGEETSFLELDGLTDDPSEGLNIEKRRARRRAEMELLEELEAVDCLSTKPIEEAKRHAEFIKKTEAPIVEATELVLNYIRDIRVNVGEGGTGNSLKFDTAEGGRKTWPDMDDQERRKTAQILGEQLIVPVVEALGRGAEVAVTEK